MSQPVTLPKGAVRFIVTEKAYARYTYHEEAAGMADALTQSTACKHRVLCVLDLSPENVRKLEAAGLKLSEKENT